MEILQRALSKYSRKNCARIRDTPAICLPSSTSALCKSGEKSFAKKGFSDCFREIKIRAILAPGMTNTTKNVSSMFWKIYT